MATCHLFTSTVALLACATTAFAQAPANDDCVNAAVIGVGTTAFDNTLATTDGLILDPLVCDMGPFGTEQIDVDLWYCFTAPTTDTYQVTTFGMSGFDTRLAVYNNACGADDPTLVVACNDDFDGNAPFEAGLTFAATMGTAYKIRLGGFSTLDVGAGNMLVQVFVPPTGPANDDCANAAVLGTGLTAFDTNLSSTDGLILDPIVCDMGAFGTEQINNDIWYCFTAPTTDTYEVTTFLLAGGMDSRLAVYDNGCGADDPALVVACNDDFDINVNFEAGLSFAATMGTAYKVRLGGFGTGTFGAGNLSVQVFVPPVPPANDDCVNAEVIAGYGTYAYDNGLATTDGADLFGFCDFGTSDDFAYEDVWFEYTATVGGCTYISTLGLVTWDSRIVVYDSTACPDDPATVLACSDAEMQPIVAPFEAGLDVDLVTGSTYLIRVGNFQVGTVGGAGSIFFGAGPVAEFNGGNLQAGVTGCVPPLPFPEGCNGDGGDQLGCTDCPCGNNAPIGTIGGCLNSSGNSSRLLPSGSTSVSLPSGDTTDLRFGITGAPPTSFNILNSGDAVAPGNMANPCFGTGNGAAAAVFDGLRCAVQNTLRHGGRSADINGEIGVTNNPWGGEGGPPVGLAVAGAGFAAGQTRFFQVIHRDDPLAVCLRGLNTSQSVEVMFTP